MIVVTGAGGQLGTAFRLLLGERATFLTRADLDFTDLDAIGPAVEALAPSAVVNCAAYTAVDAAEGDRETARTVNSLAVERLAAACAAIGARFVTFSTDYVFDGTSPDPYVESSPTGPLSVYGATKLEGERRALAAHPDALVVRTSWVMSGTHANFAATMLRLVRGGDVRVVDDQRGHPTFVSDLAPATLSALDAGATGLLHLTNAGTATWYEVARQVVSIAGFDQERISPCSTAEFPRPAPRPANSVLASERLDALGLAPMPHYAAAMERAVRQLVTP